MKRTDIETVLQKLKKGSTKEAIKFIEKIREDLEEWGLLDE